MILVWIGQVESSCWTEHREVESVAAAVEVMLEKGVDPHQCCLITGADLELVAEECCVEIFDRRREEQWHACQEENDRREYARLQAKFAETA